MDATTLLLFIPACFALNIAPGPNNLLSINNAAHHGFTASCLPGLGRLLAFSLMILLASAGLAAIILASETLFSTIKIIGAVYLFYLAIQLWRHQPATTIDSCAVAKADLLRLMRQEFIVAIGNPKAILIFTAFLPQFLSHDKPVAMQFLQLGATFLVLEWLTIAIYAYMGLHLQRWLNSESAKKIFNRTCGSLLGLAGVALLVARKDQ